ncbi:LacI family DNA-binding transcriptional regulator (plasmid) [Peteryoungia desertarenae]|uniref:LacI family DNA-binding transcriptional regulator n=1 Tax=Peteryoungia desertarenae TaxID=1813451 RepID=A0ABX6QUF1_9HYPH|nr:LacI family DNA-binding transcriptional regulator [Peteryoungia desertarenae]QLF71835.1 LacI family DNA-binding transcriptional regulator [Peteryoungia desertarenae]
MERRPTIIDVARVAGISKSTVSLVLQNSPLVKEETRLLVREAMDKVGYVYNRAAANLRSSNVGLIGLVINDLRNPFFTEFATSLQMALSARGYATVVANTDEDPVVQAQVVGAMIEHGVSALVISPAYGDDGGTFDAIARGAIPAMQVLRKVDPRVEQFPFAAPDYRQGSQLAARHILSFSPRRIAFVGGLADRAVTRERMIGYFDILAETGMEPFVLSGRASRSFGREAAEELVLRHPDIDAAICFNDLVALGMLSGFARLNRKVGEDFRMIGFDDIEECSQVFPALSTIHCGIAEFGRSVAATILVWLEEGRRPDPETLTAVELVIRDTSDLGDTP